MASPRPEDFGAVPVASVQGGGSSIRPEDFGAVPVGAVPAEQRSFGTELLRQLGLTARAGVEGLTALPNMAGDALGLRSTEAIRNALTKMGLPLPESAKERIVQDVASALAGTGGLAKVAKMAVPVSPMGQHIASSLAANLGSQTAAAVAGSGAAGATREGGGGPVAQLAAGLIAGVGAPVSAQAVKQFIPNRVASSVRKSEATPFAQEGERLAQETGIDLTLGQRTGNKLALTMENNARQYGPIADRVQEIDVKIANQAITRVTTIADRISKAKTDPAALGSRIEETVKDAARKLDQVRDSQASRDYGAVRQLAGDKPVVEFRNFADELKTIIDEHKNVPGGDAQKIAAQAQSALDRLTTSATTITEAMKARSFYGKAAKGAANVFDDIAPNMNRSMAARLFSAINRDFDQSTTNASGELRKALDKANGNYRNVSQSLEYLEKSTLGKLVGEELTDAALSGAKISTTAGEAIVKKLMDSHPSSRKTAVEILEKWNPQLAKDTRAFVLRDALDKGMSIPPSAKGASQIPISFNKFVSALQGEKVGFDKQLKSYGFSDVEVRDIKDTVAAMVRAGDRTGFNYSNTNVQGQAMEIAEVVGQGVLGNVKGAASKTLSIAGKYIGLKKFADAMASAEGRAALRTLFSPRASPQAVIAAFETIEGKQQE